MSHSNKAYVGNLSGLLSAEIEGIQLEVEETMLRLVAFDVLNATSVVERLSEVVRNCRGIRESDITAEAANPARIKEIGNITNFHFTT